MSFALLRDHTRIEQASDDLVRDMVWATVCDGVASACVSSL